MFGCNKKISAYQKNLTDGDQDASVEHLKLKQKNDLRGDFGLHLPSNNSPNDIIFGGVSRDGYEKASDRRTFAPEDQPHAHDETM